MIDNIINIHTGAITYSSFKDILIWVIVGGSILASMFLVLYGVIVTIKSIYEISQNKDGSKNIEDIIKQKFKSKVPYIFIGLLITIVIVLLTSNSLIKNNRITSKDEVLITNAELVEIKDSTHTYYNNLDKNPRDYAYTYLNDNGEPKNMTVHDGIQEENYIIDVNIIYTEDDSEQPRVEIYQLQEENTIGSYEFEPDILNETHNLYLPKSFK